MFVVAMIIINKLNIIVSYKKLIIIKIKIKYKFTWLTQGLLGFGYGECDDGDILDVVCWTICCACVVVWVCVVVP